MATIEQMIADIVNLKQRSDELSQMIAGAGTELSGIAAQSTPIFRGSKSGEDAVRALSAAGGALNRAAAEMVTLSRSCDDCINNLRR